VLSGSVLPCTEQGIRNAIAAGDATYTFACDGTAPVVTEAEIEIDNSVILDGEGKLTVDGNCAHGVFSVPGGVTAELRGFVVNHGDGGFGAGIFNRGTLTLTNSTVSGNNAGAGGGIRNEGMMTMANSIASGNRAISAGGILNEGTMTLTNSTVSGNAAFGERGIGGSGGGILNSGTMTLTNSTVSGNTADFGDGIWNDGTMTLTNSVVDDGCGDRVNSTGYNIESPGDTCGFDQDSDLFDVTEGQLNLGPLQDNGGPTMTHALGVDSVAIDHIPAVDCVDSLGAPLTTDQRGFPRDSMCDVGAFEVQP